MKGDSHAFAAPTRPRVPDRTSDRDRRQPRGAGERVYAQLHRAIGESPTYLNYAVWESIAYFRAAFMHPEFRAKLSLSIVRRRFPTPVSESRRARHLRRIAARIRYKALELVVGGANITLLGLVEFRAGEISLEVITAFTLGARRAVRRRPE